MKLCDKCVFVENAFKSPLHYPPTLEILFPISINNPLYNKQRVLTGYKEC